MNITEECNKLFLLQKEYQEENKEVNKATPLVSVSVATYQHVNYIKECLDGILMQITNFPIEIIVGEDESNDGTREICIEYANKYPDKIRLFLRDRKQSQLYDEQGNFLTRFNGIWNRMSCRGKYIAMCEGDDYWTDPYKLQKQVDFLEANEEYSMCVSNRLVKTIDGEYFKDLLSKKTITLEDVLRGQILHTQTMLFLNKGNELIDFLSDLIKEGNGGDREIGYFYALKGSIYCLPDVTAVYRMSGTGVWSRFSEQEKVWLELDAFYDFHKRIKFANRKLFANEYTKKSLDIVYYAWKRKQANPFKWKVIKSLCKRLTIAELISEIVNYGLCKIRRKK